MALLALVCGLSAGAGCTRLSNQEAQEIVEAAILITRSTAHTATVVHLARSATNASDSASAVASVKADLDSAVRRVTSTLNPVTCPCGVHCTCEGCGSASASGTRATCTDLLGDVIASFNPGCPAPVLSDDGTAISLDFGPYCQGCAVGDLRLGGKLRLEPIHSKTETVVVATLLPWVADVNDRFNFTITSSGIAGKPPTTQTVDSACFVVPDGGVRGEQFDIMGGVRTRFWADGTGFSLEFLSGGEGQQFPVFTRRDRANSITHDKVQTADAPLKLVYNDAARGLAGGYTLNGQEQWHTGDAAEPNWFFRADDAVIPAGSPLPTSGTFAIVSPNRGEVTLRFSKAENNAISVELAGDSRAMHFEVAASTQ